MSSEVYVHRKVVKKNTECVILRDYDRCYGTFDYYLFSAEGDAILTVTDCNCRQIPSVIEEMFEKFSLEEQHKKEKEEFQAWLVKEIQNEVACEEKGKCLQKAQKA